MNNLNFTHPECSESEVFLKNATNKNYKKLPYITKRKGKQAYDGLGNKLDVENWHPIFLNMREVKMLKKEIMDLRKVS